MKAFLVTVRPGPLALPERYLDSLWISKDHADKRAEWLRMEFKRSGKTPSINGSWTWVNEIEIEDAKLAPERKHDAKDKH